MEKGENNQLYFEDTAELLKLQFTDVFGQCKTVEMMRKQAEKLLKEGYAVNRSAMGEDSIGEEKLYLKPDMSTYRILPWDSGQENVARVICNVCTPEGEPSWMDSRYILQEAVKRAEAAGLWVSFDFQCEFYLFHTDEEGRPTTITHEVAGYYDAGPIDLAESVRRDIMLSLAEAGMEAESTHHGQTPGQHSFLLQAGYGVEAADYLQTFKCAVKRIAKRHGLHAAFMPKPSDGAAGSGLHVGVVIRKAEPETMELFRRGVEKHLRDMMIFTNPTVNSYKRLADLWQRGGRQEGQASSDKEDQMAEKQAVLLRKSHNGTFGVEVRFPDSSANPYLMLAAILEAGLREINPPCVPEDPEKSIRHGNTAIFPENLGVLLNELNDNHFAREVFGEKFCQMYGAGKQKEWCRFSSHITDWETAEYLYRC